MLRAFICILMLLPCLCCAASTILAARVWPASDYTRVALEANQPLVQNMTMLKNPDRLVLDIEGVDNLDILKALSAKVLGSDPYIKQIRVGNFKPGVARLVIDLKSEINPKLFELLPAGEYKYRLVLDLYPVQDPLLAMLDQQNKRNQAQDGVSVAPQKNTPSAEATEKAGVDASTSTAANEGEGVNLKLDPMLKPAMPAIENSKDTSEHPVAKPPEENLANKPEVAQGKRLITIAIDAGHGGEDPGARGANGSHEKDITLAVAKKLKEKIDAEPNMRGILTRDGDYFIPLHGRVVKARNMRADLFVSVHADAYISQDARGSSVFALSERGATSASARYLAKKENESDLIGGVSLDDKDPNLARTLLDLSQTATINDSLKLGKNVLGSIGKINKLHKGSVEQAAFAVLKSPDIPSILVETAFISNPEEEKKLNDADYQYQLVDAILTGIKKYFASNPALANTKVAQEAGK